MPHPPDLSSTKVSYFCWLPTYADYLEVYYKGQMVERLERVRGEQKARIDYRHIIWSLVRKPGAFARYRCQPLGTAPDQSRFRDH